MLDVINEGLVDCVINTPEGGRPTTLQDGFHIRRAAAERRIPCFTRIDTASAATEALLAGSQAFNVLPINEYRAAARVAGAPPTTRRSSMARHRGRKSKSARRYGRHRLAMRWGRVGVNGCWSDAQRNRRRRCESASPACIETRWSLKAMGRAMPAASTGRASASRACTWVPFQSS